MHRQVQRQVAERRKAKDGERGQLIQWLAGFDPRIGPAQKTDGRVKRGGIANGREGEHRLGEVDLPPQGLLRNAADHRPGEQKVDRKVRQKGADHQSRVALGPVGPGQKRRGDQEMRLRVHRSPEFGGWVRC